MTSIRNHLPKDLEVYLEETQKITVDRQETRNHLIRLFLLRWPSPIVSRNEIATFSGGLLSAGTLANLDSMKKGIEKIPTVGGRKVCYETIKAAQFIVDQLILD